MAAASSSVMAKGGGAGKDQAFLVEAQVYRVGGDPARRGGVGWNVVLAQQPEGGGTGLAEQFRQRFFSRLPAASGKAGRARTAWKAPGNRVRPTPRGLRSGQSSSGTSRVRQASGMEPLDAFNDGELAKKNGEAPLTDPDTALALPYELLIGLPRSLRRVDCTSR